ncbi:4Fe-4S binding protein [Desulfosudis oleivorans]|uniref:4Fe-4S ferredoxin iron-sulfur binding domain protein n=1 Tax=Desulfosudis oleivorans (strain DSM 6200 / JCM 39069 / Hxd3) TaxID=96561 RepID=A8ZST0_DESOH|nr:4Fe-4S binding protein [Desulfosudis oleivorans]ABW65993.1 4Fe-4S ferredoxin iron-sulfur binding domain protein [Desulfosudis oleivorans Hxd3]
MPKAADPYKKLNNILNMFDLKVPKSRKFTKLLKLLYTPEEAELLGHFGTPYMHMEPIGTTVRITGRNKEDVEALFENMVKKGTLFFQKGDNGERLYSLPPFIPGIYEFYTMSENDPFETKKDILKLLDDYFFETFVPEAFNSSNYPWFRVLPAEHPVKRTISIEKSVDARTRILPFEIASEYISSAQYIAVGDCACRDHAAMQDGKPRCDKPKDVCLVFESVAEYWVEKGIGRRITHEEAVNVLQRSAEAGLVHCTTNNRVFGERMSGMICNCCPCCCFILQGVLRTRGQQGIAKSNFQPVIKTEECNLCMACVDKCPVNALYHHKPHKDDGSDNFIALNESECLGCGVCVMACDNEAIQLVKVRDTVPEIDVLHMGDRHNKERRH